MGEAGSAIETGGGPPIKPPESVLKVEVDPEILAQQRRVLNEAWDGKRGPDGEVVEDGVIQLVEKAYKEGEGLFRQDPQIERALNLIKQADKEGSNYNRETGEFNLLDDEGEVIGKENLRETVMPVIEGVRKIVEDGRREDGHSLAKELLGQAEAVLTQLEQFPVREVEGGHAFDISGESTPKPESLKEEAEKGEVEEPKKLDLEVIDETIAEGINFLATTNPEAALEILPALLSQKSEAHPEMALLIKKNGLEKLKGALPGERVDTILEGKLPELETQLTALKKELETLAVEEDLLRRTFEEQVRVYCGEDVGDKALKLLESDEVNAFEICGLAQILAALPSEGEARANFLERIATGSTKAFVESLAKNPAGQAAILQEVSRATGFTQRESFETMRAFLKEKGLSEPTLETITFQLKKLIQENPSRSKDWGIALLILLMGAPLIQQLILPQEEEYRTSTSVF